MFERFTDRARRVCAIAQEEARRLNHDAIGTDHILFGLIAEGEGPAAVALRQLDLTVDVVRAKVEAGHPASASQPIGSPPFTPRAKKLLELALREALQLSHNYIGTEHMLLGLVRQGEGAGVNVLIDLGVGLDTVRTTVVELLRSYRPAGSGSTPANARMDSLLAMLRSRVTGIATERDAVFDRALDALQRMEQLRATIESQSLDGMDLVAAERIRQHTEEGWTAEHDAQHADGELLKAAAYYMALSGGTDVPAASWPWERERIKANEDPLRMLVKAGALIVAEIDRRLAATPAE